jgi:cell division septum initiation protein DivIVA
MRAAGAGSGLVTTATTTTPIRVSLSEQPLPCCSELSRKPQTQEKELPATALPPEVATDQLPRAFFGYERSRIVELLDTTSARIRELTQERAEHKRRIGELEDELQRSLENQRLIGETLVKAREEATAIREEARRSAERDLRAARKHGERIAAEAEQDGAAKAKALVEAAHRERQQLIDEALRQRQTLLDEAARARAFIDETHEQLSDFLMAAVRWYEQAKPSAERRRQLPSEPDNSPKESSSIPSDLTAALTRGSQSTSSSTGLSDE